MEFLSSVILQSIEDTERQIASYKTMASGYRWRYAQSIRQAYRRAIYSKLKVEFTENRRPFQTEGIP